MEAQQQKSVFKHEVTSDRCDFFGNDFVPLESETRRQQDYPKTEKIPIEQRTKEDLKYKRYRFIIFVAYLGRNYHGFQKADNSVLTLC